MVNFDQIFVWLAQLISFWLPFLRSGKNSTDSIGFAKFTCNCRYQNPFLYEALQDMWCMQQRNREKPEMKLVKWNRSRLIKKRFVCVGWNAPSVWWTSLALVVVRWKKATFGVVLPKEHDLKKNVKHQKNALHSAARYEIFHAWDRYKLFPKIISREKLNKLARTVAEEMR